VLINFHGNMLSITQLLLTDRRTDGRGRGANEPENLGKKGKEPINTEEKLNEN
jgi:hypothetical protein